jgi:hypothetical protein
MMTMRGALLVLLLSLLCVNRPSVFEMLDRCAIACSILASVRTSKDIIRSSFLSSILYYCAMMYRLRKAISYNWLG